MAVPFCLENYVLCASFSSILLSLLLRTVAQVFGWLAKGHGVRAAPCLLEGPACRSSMLIFCYSLYYVANTVGNLYLLSGVYSSIRNYVHKCA